MKLERRQKDIIVESLIEFLSNKIDSEKDVENGYASDTIGNDTNLYGLFDEDQMITAIDTPETKAAFTSRSLSVLLENNKLLVIQYGDYLDEMNYAFMLFKNGGDFTVETKKEGSFNYIYLRDKKGQNVTQTFYTSDYFNVPKTKVNKLLKPVSLEQIFERSEELSK